MVVCCAVPVSHRSLCQEERGIYLYVTCVGTGMHDIHFVLESETACVRKIHKWENSVQRYLCRCGIQNGICLCTSKKPDRQQFMERSTTSQAAKELLQLLASSCTTYRYWRWLMERRLAPSALPLWRFLPVCVRVPKRQAAVFTRFRKWFAAYCSL